MRVLRRIKLWFLNVNKLLSSFLLPSSSFLSRLLSFFICSSRLSDRENIGVPVTRHLLRERGEVNCLSNRNEAVMVTLKYATQVLRYHNPVVNFE